MYIIIYNMSIGDWLQRGRMYIVYIDPLPIAADVFNVLKIIFHGDSAKADGTNKTLICYFFSLNNFLYRLGRLELYYVVVKSTKKKNTYLNAHSKYT